MKRRMLSLLLALALAMVMSAVPVANAAETVSVEETVPVETATVSETETAEAPVEETRQETVEVTEAPSEEPQTEPTVATEIVEETVSIELERQETVPVLEASGAIASGTFGSNMTWSLSATGTLTISGSGSMSAAPWTDYTADIKTVTIKSGVTSIGDKAFYDCANLTKVTIPSTVTRIGNRAFEKCGSLASITLPSSVGIIGYSAFSGCKSLTKITIPEGVTEIQSNTFYECDSLKTVTLPDTIEAIGYGAFKWCTALTGITLYQGLTSIDSDAFFDCDSLTSVTLPNTLTAISSQMFYSCDNLKKVTIPSSVTSIGKNAFYGTALTAVSIPASVTSIATHAFSECAGLTEIRVNSANPNYSSDSRGVLYNKDKTTVLRAPGALSGSYSIPQSVTTIAEDAFQNCAGMTSVTIPDTVTSIGKSAFAGCSGLTQITFPKGITRLEEYVLARCKKLTSFTIPESVTTIERSALASCESLPNIVIPNGVTSIGESAFYSCKSLTSIIIPDTVTSFGDMVFFYCENLTDVVFPEGITRITDMMFAECMSLPEITIPDSVTIIDDWAFISCRNLKTIYFEGDAPNINSNAFTKVVATAYYPTDNTTWTADKMQNYNGTLTWVPYGEHTHRFDENHKCSCGIYGGQCDDTYWALTEDGTLTISGSGAMPDYSDSDPNCAPWHDLAVKKVVVEEGVTTIGAYAFWECNALTEVSLPSTLTAIMTHAFSGCGALTQLTVPEGVTQIGSNAFMNCSGLTEISLPDTVNQIGQMAFSGCTGLTSVKIPANVTSLENCLFTDCSNLKEVLIPDGVTAIGPGVFSYCSNLNAIVLPGSVTEIGDLAFSGSGLHRITFTGDAPSFGEKVFQDVTADAHYPDGNKTWTEAVMQDYGGSITWLTEHKYESEVILPTCTEPGCTIYTCSLCGGFYQEAPTDALGHSYQREVDEETGVARMICIVCGDTYDTVTRISGKDRCATSRLVADTMMEELGGEKFDAILYTSGDNFADALAGSYLAVQKKAPILLYRASGAAANLEYIQANLSDGGTVYLLGGDAAVPADVETSLRNAGIHVERLSGKNRFLTNIAILNAAGFTGGEILVCTGYNFADSLSASAAGRPILLVKQEWTELNQDYVNYIDGLEGCTFTIIGGTGAVSAELAADLENYGTVDRVYGKTRYQTSVAVAERFIQDPESAVLAYAKNFPDGLCGGPLACLLGAPLILTDDINAATAAAYTKANGITEGIVLGGNILISDESANLIFGQ